MAASVWKIARMAEHVGNWLLVEVSEGHSGHLCEGLVDQLRLSFPIPRTVGSH